MSNAQNYGNDPAVSWKEDGEWVTLNWSQYHDYTMDVAKSLIAMGFREGENLAIYSYNRVEWFSAYIAANCCGGAASGIYQTSSPEEVKWVVTASDSRFIFVGNNPLDGGDPSKMCSTRLLSVLDECGDIEAVILMNGIDMDHPKAISWADFMAKGSGVPDSEVTDRIGRIQASDTASLIWTSGTTGRSKGCVLSHGNFDVEIDAIHEIERFGPGQGYISYLPASHIFEQVAAGRMHIHDAMHMSICASPLQAIDYAKEAHPSLMIGVPRIWESVYSNLKATLDEKAVIRIGLKLPVLGGVLRNVIKKKVGLDQCVWAITGAAAIDPEVLKLMHYLDIPLYEGYGMSEQCCGVTIGSPRFGHKYGSVGKCFVGEIRIDQPDENGEGEIQSRGPNVMSGYYNEPELTAEAFTADGWLKTGDLGRLDEEGFLYITGRIKELLNNQSGELIPPIPTETDCKALPIVGQCVLVGDNRKYCTALITLDVAAILRDRFGLDGATQVPKNPVEQVTKLNELGAELSDFTESEEVRAEIQAHIDVINKNHKSPARIRKFTILPRDLSIDYNELTPTLKLKRPVVSSNWADEIEAMYADA